MSLSPTLINKFDASGKYDCERRGYFVYVLGQKEPTNEKMTRGTHLALMQEIYLKEQRVLEATEEQTRWFNKLRPHLDEIRPRLVGAELPMPPEFNIAGVPIHLNSKADIVLDGPAEIQDLKTTGNIEKNGKSRNQLKKDTQLAIYRKAFYPGSSEVTLTHLYLQVEGALVFKPVSVTVSQKELDDHFETVTVPLVERIKSIVSEKDIKKVEADRRKCFRCPHRSYCPPEKENPLMSIFDKFKPASAAPITPPDQPKSDPAQAAKPVEGFQAVPPPKTEEEKAARKHKFVDAPSDAPAEDEEAVLMRKLAEAKAKKEAAAKAAAEAAAKEEAEKKAAAAKAEAEAKSDAPADDGEERKGKGGRPPGSKNKPKMDGEETTEVAYGVTMNLGIDVGAVRIDVRRSKRHGLGEAGEVYEQLLAECKGAVAEEMKKVSSSPAGKKG